MIDNDFLISSRLLNQSADISLFISIFLFLSLLVHFDTLNLPGLASENFSHLVYMSLGVSAKHPLSTVSLLSTNYSRLISSLTFLLQDSFTGEWCLEEKKVLFIFALTEVVHFQVHSVDKTSQGPFTLICCAGSLIGLDFNHLSG